MENLLTKSDFLVAQECPTKLYYKKLGMPTSDEGNEFRDMLAEGGYIVGKLAQLLYPDGILAGSDTSTEAAIEATKALLESEKVTLFEATVKHGAMLARFDILQKECNTLRIIEVKSKAYSKAKFANKEKDFDKNWAPTFQDVAFQKLVLAGAYPEMVIETYLMMPDQGKYNEIEGLASMFEKKEVRTESGTKKLEILFTGDFDVLKFSPILTKIRVDEFLTPDMSKEVTNQARFYEASLLNNERIVVPISTSCNKCNYTVKNANFVKSGFEICWGELASKKPHVLDVSEIGSFNNSKGKPIDELIKEGKVLQHEIPKNLIEGKRNNRAYHQIYTNSEIFDDTIFIEKVNELVYPLHFIDFEDIRPAVPYHAGMRPYDVICFQWSCHTVKSKGAKPEHSEWLNTFPLNPNIEFLRSLKECIGDKGSILVWSNHEEKILKELKSSCNFKADYKKDLLVWLTNLLENSNRFIDLYEVNRKGYFHPLMGKHTSVKATLPAVLAAMGVDKASQLLKDFNLFAVDENDAMINPYKVLPKVDVSGETIDVHEGTGAMQAYWDMLYGKCKDNPVRAEAVKKALLQYCHLDTLAMVIIWEHWSELAG